jgi:ADP-heptose:LPS heptosyltransferase
MKVLILRFSSIGDIVLTSPVVRCLKNQLPDVQIHYAVKSKFKSLVETNPYIEKVHELYDLYALIKILRFERFDVIIDLHNNLRTKIIKSALGISAYTFDKLNWEKYWLVRTKYLSIMPNIHIVDRYMETVKDLGIENDEKGLDFFIPNNSAFDTGTLPMSHQSGFVAIVIGGTHSTKRLPNEKIIELIHHVNGPILLLGGPEDKQNAAEIENYTNKELVCNLVGGTTLFESGSLVKAARYVITHDTGLMHIAAAFHKTIFTIWGNTVPQLGMYAYGTTHTDIEVQGLTCRPCSKIGYDACPLQHFNCMNQQEFSAIPTWDSWNS